MANKSILIVLGIILVIGIIVGTVLLLPDEEVVTDPIPAEVPQQQPVAPTPDELPDEQPVPTIPAEVPEEEAPPTEITPQGQIAFVSAGHLHIINADGSGEKRLAATRSGPVWCPDGNSIAFLGENGNLSVIDIHDLEITQITETEGARFFQWLPDGRRLLLQKEGFWLVNRDGTGLLQIMPLGEHPRGDCPSFPMISPDGTKVACFVWLGGECHLRNWALATINIDGTGQVVLSEGYRLYRKMEVNRVAWSADGEKLAYNTELRLRVMNSDGTNRIDLGTGGIAHLDTRRKNHVFMPYISTTFIYCKS
ncbi:hypothetical protein M1N44_03600 [Dehalococcoidia bacterium]|nr:hypothetical protein [Dehalococcoidia bacterium]